MDKDRAESHIRGKILALDGKITYELCYSCRRKLAIERAELVKELNRVENWCKNAGR